MAAGCGPNVLIKEINVVKYLFRRNGRHCADNFSKCIFLNADVWILNNISSKFAPQSQFSNIPALVPIKDLCRPDDKPWSGPMIFRILTHICTRPQWVDQAMTLTFIMPCHSLYIYSINSYNLFLDIGSCDALSSLKSHRHFARNTHYI